MAPLEEELVRNTNCIYLKIMRVPQTVTDMHLMEGAVTPAVHRQIRSVRRHRAGAGLCR